MLWIRRWRQFRGLRVSHRPARLLLDMAREQLLAALLELIVDRISASPRISLVRIWLAQPTLKGPSLLTLICFLETDTLVGGRPAHEVLIALKNHPGPPPAVSPKYPDAFPRVGAVKLFENRRVILWNYSWVPGRPTRDRSGTITWRPSPRRSGRELPIFTARQEGEHVPEPAGPRVEQLSTHVAYQTPYLRMREDRIRRPDGSEVIYS